MNRFKGFVYGMIASSTFGLIPLFTLPMMGEGLTTDSILTYRMFLACLLVALLMWVRGVSLRTNLRELRWFAFLGFFYYGSAALLFQGYHTMSNGHDPTLPLPDRDDSHHGDSLPSAYLYLYGDCYRSRAVGGRSAEPPWWGRADDLGGRGTSGTPLWLLLCDLPRDGE